MRKTILISLNIVISICLSCKTQEFNSTSTNPFIIKYKIENVNKTTKDAIYNFALQTYNNCYYQEFPKITNDIASELLISEWGKTKIEFIKVCEKYSHQYGKLKSLNLYEVLGSENENKCFRYKAQFTHSNKVVEIRVITNQNNKYHKITFLNKWYD